ncbi:mercury(II) reductase [Chengkuizengella axinellae]|uniref:Mercuric reductase n=1 Tax=Chengkuizengella axinellae TaxID=3064388 RepID=A0ABT9J4D5_9BACL|nr:mercury(II) reductase [Chengkuizengella sp. 2205SS18-9]MDP5276473.1 mercury(II) reductase [Chengkuizengella sp. 2205SS18-9]
MRVRIEIRGMTCTSCEGHIQSILKNLGAQNIDASYLKNNVEFQLPSTIDIEIAHKAIHDANYEISHTEIIQNKEITDKKSTEDYDLFIIGSGGAAFSAAIKAIEYGAKVAMVERGIIGGTCVNVGCVPSKTLLRAGEINNLAKQNPFNGLNTSAGIVNLEALVEQKNELVMQLRSEKYVNLIDEYGFKMFKGEAKFIDENTVEVNSEKITSKYFLIATGASPSIPYIPGLKEVDYLTSTSLLELKQLPKSLIVIGSGYIGMELGQLFHNLGTEVTLIQRSERVLKNYDLEISEAVEKALTEQGINVIKGVTYESIDQDGDTKKVRVTVNGQEKVIEAEQLLIATGRKPNTNYLQLSEANVKVGSRGEVLIDEYARTSNTKIYAAGDVTMAPQFVYVAAYQGGIVADNAIGGLNRKLNLESVPGVTFTNPSIATVGLTEEQAKQNGFDVKTSVLPLDAVPRALVNRETTGVFKLVADAKTLKVLGVHIVAENAGEVIYAATLAVKFGLTIDDLRESLAPYLTMAEGLKLAALTFDKDVSKLSCCAG